MSEPLLPSPRHIRPHIVVPGRGQDIGYRGRGGGRPSRIRATGDPAAHASRLKDEFTDARERALGLISELPEEIQAEGFPLCVEGWSDEPGYELALSSLDASGLRLLTVLPAEDSRPEQALVWVPENAAGAFLRKLEDFAAEGKNQNLVSNIAALRLAVLRNFWQENEPFPETEEPRWWEVWFARLPGNPDPSVQLGEVCRGLGLRFHEQTLGFPERVIGLVHGSPSELSRLLTANTVVAELRRPPVVSDILDEAELERSLAENLQERLVPADSDSPAVCLLDTGVNTGHRLLRDSVDEARSVLPSTTGADSHGHGTRMAGLSLYGDLTIPLLSSDRVQLRHRLESVKICQPDRPEASPPPQLYGALMASAASEVEIPRPWRHRVFSLPVSTSHEDNDGRPSSWSAALDALSFGTDIRPTPTGLELLGHPDPERARLFCVAAGNVQHEEASPQFLDVCDLRSAQDPSQAWNVLTVGGHTDLTDLPAGPEYRNCTPLAPKGELSPHSRTSRTWSELWPSKPDIVMEAGNLVTDGPGPPLTVEELELLTTSHRGGLTTANATSAATAQAARLCALVMDRYPALWPETVRGLLVHSAEWTDSMKAALHAKDLKKGDRARLLRRYGWGVPTEERVLASADENVTMIVQDEFRPFEWRHGGISMRALRLHELPWPRKQLMNLAAIDVRLRITLSYFVEPNPSNWGWKQYQYPSHRLKFELKRPNETVEEFRRRVSQEAQEEEDNPGLKRRDPDNRNWLIGARGRRRGSLHADMWTGYASELAHCNHIAIIPIGGWWKNNKRKDRLELPVRYSLLVSLACAAPTDIYSPIAAQIGIGTEITT
ncbi:S8 family peptidase [Thermomonospora catenispora]|uniref:S8 family peptidase n=1 Tax=Thermomonospora catenispora TaxID=2493090 RepID=UPI00111E7C45|nr:S8 family peptidase [Thermomonospora catenispora]TNY34720.1 S8 family peptidase [Thermomonospora catenispora]